MALKIELHLNKPVVLRQPGKQQYAAAKLNW